MSRMKEKRMLREKFSAELAQLRVLDAALQHSYACFNQGLDPEILEACIHEISALRSRRSAAWRNIKSMDGDKIKWQSR